MNYSTASYWDSPHVGSADGVLAWATSQGSLRLDFLADALDTWYTIGPQVHLNPDLCAAHSAHECGDPKTGRAWQSLIYRTRGVLDGLGVTDGADMGLVFLTGREAALADLIHKYAYVHGAIARDNPLYPHIALDPRYRLVIEGGNAGKVVTVADMGGKWWTDPNGAKGVAGKAQAMFGAISTPVEQPPAGGTTVPDLNMTKGLIPLPQFHDWLIPDANNQAWDDLGQRTVKGFVLHRQLGSNLGTNSYFRSLSTGGSAGLTDYGQDSQTGEVIRWNDPLGAAHDVDYTMSNGQRVKGHVSANRAGWASGVYNGAYGDGLKFATKYGINAINRDQASWEIDRFYGDPWSAEAMQIAAQACAHYAHDYGIPWDVFPIAPQDGFSFVRWHQEFTLGTGKVCPGDVVMAQTDTFIGLVKAILKQYQTASVPAEPPVVVPIPVNPYPKGMTKELAREIYGSVSVSWASEPFTFDLDRSECRAWLEFGKGTIPAGKDYRDGNWGTITGVIRRGNKGSAGRVYRYSNGFVYFQAPAKEQKGKVA